MFKINIYAVLFYAIPVLLLLFFGFSLYRYLIAKKRNKAVPGTFTPKQIKTRLILLIIAAVIPVVLVTIVLGLFLLLIMAIGHM